MTTNPPGISFGRGLETPRLKPILSFGTLLLNQMSFDCIGLLSAAVYTAMQIVNQNTEFLNF